MQKTRVLVIGVGSIGERHVRCFLETGRVDAVICEINDALRAQIADRYSVSATFADLDEAIAERPEAAVICTPAHLHIPMAIQLAEAGVHLLIEKPLGIAIDGVDRLVDLVNRNNLTAAVAYVWRMNPPLAEMRRAIQSGRFGDPVQVIGVSGQHFPFYRPAYRDIYYKDRATGGGAIQDALTHFVDAGQWLIGPVTRLAADAAHLVLDGVTVEDTVHLIARHSAVMGSYSLNQHQALNETNITVVCTEGTVRCELSRNRWLAASSPTDDLVVQSECRLDRDDLFLAQTTAFLDAIAGRSPPVCSLDEGLQTLRTNLAILQAADSHEWQTIPEHEG
jgi:predicted dehydrogenase